VVPRHEKAELMRAVNDGIAFFASDVKPSDPSVPDRWSFLCECAVPGCHAWVELELAAYAEIRSRPDEAVLAPGHVADREVAGAMV
jgi:hypothetical protein